MNPDAWPKPYTETPKPVEETEQVEAEQNIEQELSPEQIEQIMTKVQDVLKKGNGLTVLRERGNSEYASDNGKMEKDSITFESLKSIFKDGLLGTFTIGHETKEKFSSKKDKWLQETYKERRGIHFGNIIGRDVCLESGESMLGEFRNEFGVVYNLSGYVETTPTYMGSNTRGKCGLILSNEQINTKIRKTNVRNFWKLYGSADPGLSEYSLTPHELNELKDNLIVDQTINNDWDSFLADLISKKIKIDSIGLNSDAIVEKAKKAKSFEVFFGGVTSSGSDNGFVIGRRIAPRRFIGLVWHQPKRVNSVSSEEYLSNINSRLRSVVQIMQQSKKITPIYDEYANLVWPKQMSYDEVKQFVAERDAKNTNKEEK